MNTSKVQPLIDFVEESFELIQALKDAKEDGKIRLFEWVGIVRESSDVFNAIKELKDIDISQATETDIQEHFGACDELN